jgi:hypothetical protein
VKTIEPEQETGRWLVDFKVEKWFDPRDKYLGHEPNEVVYGESNVLTTAGITRMLSLLIGGGGQAFTNTHARLGVGTGSTAVTSADTDLAGGSKLYHGMDATYPSVVGNVVTFQASFADSQANFAWNEWGIDCGGAGTGATNAVVVAPLLNRRVPPVSLGTKTGGIWILTVTITIS